MTKRSAATDKILVLGVDGMDPRLTRKYVDQGKLPNVKKYLERGASRKDLSMLGGHPTVTPPMWTTLATGCYANVHGITGFFRQSKQSLDAIEYNIDSRLCHAEQLWNVFAEAGKKTLVFHWPGSSWPPSSDSPNLMVVDGTSPGSVGMAVAQVESNFLFGANENVQKISFTTRATSDATAPCIIEGLDLDDQTQALQNEGFFGEDGAEAFFDSSMVLRSLILNENQRGTSVTEDPLDLAQSPIKPASGWANAPEGAKEFTLLLSKGYIHRPGLILKDENGEYTKVAIFKNKKATTPIVVLTPGVLEHDVIDESVKGDNRFTVNRNMKLLNLAKDGSQLSIYISGAMDITNDSVYHPKRLFKEICDNVGFPPPSVQTACQNPELITGCMLANWDYNAEWQAKSLLYLIEHEQLDCVFSHFHAIDLQSHSFIKHLADKPFNRLPHEAYEKFMEDIYIQTDTYLGKFLHLLDEGWTIIICSDHAQVAPKHDIQYLGEVAGVNVRIMQELGFTVLKTDEQGNELPEIDWTKTKAIAPREEHIYINLKGRDPHGIVEPEDKYELEEEIMTALYGYRDKKTGHRVVSVALRNRDAVLLGQGGPEAGDICYWLAEGYNNDHSDCLSTTLGESDTSVAPIFIASGSGIKEGFYTDRYIREVDVAPTIAALGGVRMPAQCEGAPVYQIFAEEF